MELEKKEELFFCKIQAQSSALNELTSFHVFNDAEHKLTKEILAEKSDFKDFANAKENKGKKIYVEYFVYKTSEKIDNSTPNENLQRLIDENKCDYVAQTNLDLDEKEDKKKAKKKKAKNKGSGFSLLKVGGIGLACVLVGGFGTFKTLDYLGYLGDNKKSEKVTAEESVMDNGMIIPQQEEIRETAKHITITIDRSYNAVPTEDLQLKGEVKGGKAVITLPEFDKTDFFNHVEGYTYGFSTDPNGTKIQYYGGKTYKFSEDKKLYRVLVKYAGGTGTKEDPYLIDYFDQLELIAKENARGYFKQIEDIEFPNYAKHTPIDTINNLKDSPDSDFFEYDGNGYVIKNLKNSLFGTVSGAIIKNVNIVDSRISTDKYDDIGFIANRCLTYSFKTNKKEYTTGETLIQHCSVIRSSIVAEKYNAEEEEENTEPTTESVEVIAPDVIEYDENGEVIEEQKVEEPTKTAEYCIGGITGVGGVIKDCYVNKFEVSCKLDDYFLYVGGISGKPQSITDSVTNGFTTNGKIFTVGGAVGCLSGVRMYDVTGKELPTTLGGSIKGVVVRSVELASEVACGGLVGETTSAKKNCTIANSYAKDIKIVCGEVDVHGAVTKLGNYGGAVGSDGNETYGHTVTNTVIPYNLNVFGNKVLSKFDDTVRQAPNHAYYQENILTVLNKNCVDKDTNEIYTGTFMFNDYFGDASGYLAFPKSIEDIFSIATRTQEE